MCVDDEELVINDMGRHFFLPLYISRRNYECGRGCSWLINIMFTTAVVSNKNCGSF